jgi:hypothetical protein
MITNSSNKYAQLFKDAHALLLANNKFDTETE